MLLRALDSPSSTEQLRPREGVIKSNSWSYIQRRWRKMSQPSGSPRVTRTPPRRASAISQAGNETPPNMIGVRLPVPPGSNEVILQRTASWEKRQTDESK